MPREIHTFEQDPKRFAGLTARRIEKGLPVGSTDAVETQGRIEAAKAAGDWETVETETAGFYARRSAAAVAALPLSERIGR